MLAVVVASHNFRVGDRERDRQMPGTHCPASLGYLLRLRSV